jgi:hypothetical protein
MEEQRTATLPSITINDINFTLIKKTKHDNHRDVVKIKSVDSNGQQYIFWAYRSNSEMGLWRLGMFDETFYKGVDYVQTTLIHLDLQIFINNNLNNIPYDNMNYMNLDNFDNRVEECYCLNRIEDFEDEFSEDVCDMKVISQIVDDNRRIIYEPPFENMYFNKGNVDCGKIIDKYTNQEYLNTYMNNFSKLFESEFDYEEETKVFEYNFVFEETINITNQIYSVKLTKKPDKKITNPRNNKTNEIILYFDVAYLKENETLKDTHPFYENITKICKMPMHIFPFLITTTTSQINSIGLYSHYVFAGPYLCKLFDYSSNRNKQCTLTEEKEYKCTRNYSYIGNRYLDLFPLKNILENIRQRCTREGGSRRKYTRKRRKIKRKQSKYKKRKQI